jgi:hypothetical protein
MPGKTGRAEALLGLFHARKRILIDNADSDTDEINEAMAASLELTATIQQQRTLKRSMRYRNKGFKADAAFQVWITDQRYQVYCHMTRTSFEFIHRLILDDPVFVNPNCFSPSQQRSIYFQLFVALSRLATSDGDGWCIDKTCESFNIEHGTVSVGPTLADTKYGFPGFIASFDGTMIGLRRAPVFDMCPETYHHH